jgi:hypothetical protein
MAVDQTPEINPTRHATNQGGACAHQDDNENRLSE